jgi:Antitoxin VbhA
MAKTKGLKSVDFDPASAVESVLASFRMEGLEPDAETEALLREYAAGSISLEQLGWAIERHVARITPSIASGDSA